MFKCAYIIFGIKRDDYFIKIHYLLSFSFQNSTAFKKIIQFINDSLKLKCIYLIYVHDSCFFSELLFKTYTRSNHMRRIILWYQSRFLESFSLRYVTIHFRRLSRFDPPDATSFLFWFCHVLIRINFSSQMQ